MPMIATAMISALTIVAMMTTWFPQPTFAQACNQVKDTVGKLYTVEPPLPMGENKVCQKNSPVFLNSSGRFCFASNSFGNTYNRLTCSETSSSTSTQTPTSSSTSSSTSTTESNSVCNSESCQRL